MIGYSRGEPRGSAVTYSLGKNALRDSKTWGYQGGYSKSITCPKCGGDAILAVLFDDKWGNVSESRPKDAKIWPHDSMAVANYICRECGKMTSEWDQA